jgi:hypothetical protein
MKRVALFACLTLAACGGEPETDQNVSVEVPPPATRPTPPAEASPVPSETPTPTPTPTLTPTEAEGATDEATGPVASIPAAWRGDWGGSDGCGRMATTRLTVDGRRLTFYESEGTASRIERRSPRELSMVLSMTGEGESWTRRATLKLSPDGKRLTRTEAGQATVTYIKCRG